jgi:hypothetical protein
MKRSEKDGKKVRKKEEWSIMCVREREREGERENLARMTKRG